MQQDEIAVTTLQFVHVEHTVASTLVSVPKATLEEDSKETVTVKLQIKKNYF